MKRKLIVLGGLINFLPKIYHLVPLLIIFLYRFALTDFVIVIDYDIRIFKQYITSGLVIIFDLFTDEIRVIAHQKTDSSPLLHRIDFMSGIRRNFISLNRFQMNVYS
jgi:hypothetical protein